MEDTNSKRQRITQLQAEIDRLNREIVESDEVAGDWKPREFYTTYYVMAGAFLGLFGAVTSLLFNVIGASLVPPPGGLSQHPLNLIRVFLTFPLGDDALHMDQGVAIAIGCCLYLGTGMLLGIPIHLILSKYFAEASFATRLVVSVVLGLLIWAINFYGILSWLQPMLFGGDWIVRLIPPWVAAATHVVFAVTMAVLFPFGKFKPQDA